MFNSKRRFSHLSPEKRREKLAKAFEAYQNAETNYLLVREEAAYLVGVEVGRRTRQ